MVNPLLKLTQRKISHWNQLTLRANQLLTKRGITFRTWMNMAMDSGWDSWLPIPLEWFLERTSLGTLLQDSLRITPMIILEWETGSWLSGKGKDFTILQPAMRKQERSMLYRT